MQLAKVLRRCNPLRAFRRQGGRPSRRRLERTLAAKAAALDELQLQVDQVSQVSHAGLLQEDEFLELQLELQSYLLVAKAAQQDAATAEKQCSSMEQQLLLLLQRLLQVRACSSGMSSRGASCPS
jgi:hypothetical protein